MPLLSLLRKFREIHVNRMVDSKSDNRIKRVVSKISGKYKNDICSPNGIVITILKTVTNVTKSVTCNFE